jgi:hypothetical protein
MHLRLRRTLPVIAALAIIGLGSSARAEDTTAERRGGSTLDPLRPNVILYDSEPGS